MIQNTSDFTIKKITEKDLPKLAEEMYMDPNYAKQVKDMMARDDMAVFAVVHDGQFVGRCSLWLAPVDEPEPRAEIPGVPFVNALEVHPDFYRRGIASMLITALEDEVKERGGNMLALGVEPQNTPGKALYEKLGFTYRTVQGKETYQSSWLETQPDGSTKRYEVATRLMVKDLS